MPKLVLVRPAESRDVDVIYQLLLPFAEKKVLLPRTHDDLFQHLQEFIVAEREGGVVGVAALHVYNSNLAEVRSLVVSTAHQGKGIGHLLVGAAEKLAAGLGISDIFALTYVTGFFQGMGYRVVEKETLPHKIWTVCIHCAKFADCDEVAVQKRLSLTSVEPVKPTPIVEEIV